MTKNGFSLTGTTGSTFTGVQAFKAGKIGYRNIGGDQYRVRVEPNNGSKLSFDSSWKTPNTDGLNRYSVVVSGVDSLVQTVAAASRVLAAASIVEVPEVPAVAAIPAHLAIQ